MISKSFLLANIVFGVACAGIVAAGERLHCPSEISDANFQENVNEKHVPWAIYLYANEDNSV